MFNKKTNKIDPLEVKITDTRKEIFVMYENLCEENRRMKSDIATYQKSALKEMRLLDILASRLKLLTDYLGVKFESPSVPEERVVKIDNNIWSQHAAGGLGINETKTTKVDK